MSELSDHAARRMHSSGDTSSTRVATPHPGWDCETDCGTGCGTDCEADWETDCEADCETDCEAGCEAGCGTSRERQRVT
ncbi:MAG: hypothetical protein LC135_12045 [Phycisphaerae bacterium]|jgi:hypothetical protein|nr:hypothetical protein [Phycisphaerae bacterium]MCZ2400581.1 hypothetical protein [Phycisphaerae bacterium]NUQ50673.1 hypothetical protein [Phycisphaerae bacterium]